MSLAEKAFNILNHSRNGQLPPRIDKIFLEHEILPHVFKPARYLGLEQGAYRKPFSKASVTMCAAFPDLYEIGFSNYGLKLLYSLVNQQPEYMCDRVYAPAPDFKEKLADAKLPLYGVESFVPLRDFDVLAFSLQYELNYTTILGLLDAAQIPFRSADRTEGFPLLIAGGPGSANPMPLAPFIDVFIIGDGEEVLIEILDTLKQAKRERLDKPALLQQLGKLEGLFIPGVTEQASKRIVDIAENPVELAPLIPMIGAVHDRVTVEARRGCDRMCRFCQPCFINLPVREQSIENVKKSALKEIEKTGYEECSLLSLSIADYSYFKPLILEVAEALEEENVSLSLPSQRADRFSVEVAEAVQSIRKSTLTFAPEAGTARMRNVINKNLTDAEIMKAVTTAYQSGWNKVKLYFIIGLPTETHEDLDGIVDTIRRMQKACADIKRDKTLSIKNHLEINVTLSNFVPKPHTPFQWFPQDTMEQLAHKKQYLRDKFRGFKGVKLNFTDPEISKMEAVISRGGPELSDVIEAAYRKGAYLDAWDDLRNFDRWFEALKEHGIEYEAYTRERCCEPKEPLPWDPIDVGLDKDWLEAEYRRATGAINTTPCFEECSTCGVCSSYGTWPKFTETPKKRSENESKPPAGTEEIPQTKKEPACKVRLRMEKKGDLKFISHLDWLRMIYRAVGRSKLPVAWSQGFNPKPKISFGPALPLFTESLCEYVDVELTEPITGVKERLNPYLPSDSQVQDEALIPIGTPSIDKSISLIRYKANYSLNTTCGEAGNQVNMTERIAFLKKQTILPVEIESKQKAGGKPPGDRQSIKALDLVPYLESLEIVDDDTVAFGIRRLPLQKDRNKRLEIGEEGCKGQSGSCENASPREADDDERCENQTLASIKPAWVLSLIDTSVHWSLTRTHIELTPAKERVAAT
jgi:radical SAM-linked protein